jgi:AraC-like DNA-binding protein
MREGAVMARLEYTTPCEALREYVSLYYLVEIEHPHFEDGERAAMPQLRFILDGSAILHLPDGSSEHCVGALFVGPTSGAVRFETKGPFRMFGMGVQAAGWGALTPATAADYTDQVFPARELLSDIDRYLSILRPMKTLEEMAATADQALQPVIDAAAPELLQFSKMVDDWLASGPSPSVSDLHHRSCLSERQLTRRVKQLYGMPPKYLARKYRALRAARALVEAGQNEIDYLRDAFYDQSHMIRELKLFTGTTPSRLRDGEGDIARLIDRRSVFDGKTSLLTTRT